MLSRRLAPLIFVACAACGNCGEPEDDGVDPNNIITEADTGEMVDMGNGDMGSDDPDMAPIDMAPMLDPAELVLSTPEVLLRRGEERTISAMIVFAGEMLEPMELTWTSADESIATVDGDGTITADSANTGATSVTASTTYMEDEIEASLPVIVIAPYSALGAGGAHTCGSNTVGSLFCWGASEDRQTGHPALDMFTRPRLVDATFDTVRVDGGARHTCAVDSDGGVWCWGANDVLQAGAASGDRLDSPQTVIASGIRFIALGADFTCALMPVDLFEPTMGGEISCWGSNGFGQLGNDSVATSTEMPVIAGPSDTQWQSVVAGDRHVCAKTLQGETYCWGDNRASQLGDGTVMQQSTTPVLVDGTYAQLAAAGDWTCGTTAGGTVECWGSAAEGLPNGSSDVPVEITLPADVAAAGIALGQDHGCIEATSGEVLCWGANDVGQLGDQTTTARGDADYVFGMAKLSGLVAGDAHTCGLNTRGDLFCWGAGTSGQLGDAGLINRRSPTVAASPLYP